MPPAASISSALENDTGIANSSIRRAAFSGEGSATATTLAWSAISAQAIR
jgi:hypothetical protein